MDAEARLARSWPVSEAPDIGLHNARWEMLSNSVEERDSYVGFDVSIGRCSVIARVRENGAG